MLDDFTAEYRDGRAPLDAVLDKLNDLQDLGINAIEFMPWTSWPEGEFSWGYDPVSFFSVEYNYYNDSTQPLEKLYRLKALINELHKRNIHVIMDGVFNHANAGIDPNKGFAYFWLYQDRYIVALNFSSFDQVINIPFPENGNWQDLLSDTTIQVQNYFFEHYLLGSNWGVIFKFIG